MQPQINPSHIMQIGMGFFASKTLLSAVELGLFSVLAEKNLTAKELEQKLGLHHRATADFLDTLVALNLLNRKGNDDKALYSNTEETALFLVKNSAQYIGGILEMANARLYHSWGHLTEGLKTGCPQNELKTAKSKEDLFATLYSDPHRLETFLNAMAGIQRGNFYALAQSFPFSKYKTVCDIGGASGACSIALAQKNPHLICTTYDLPQVAPIAKRNIEDAHLTEKVKVIQGDFFKDAFPPADVITMGNILHDWGLKDKIMLIKKAYEALPSGGALIAIENIIDNERRKNAFGLMMSLNMLIETDEGFDYTGEQFKQWCIEAGFKSVEIMPLTGPTSAAIAIK